MEEKIKQLRKKLSDLNTNIAIKENKKDEILNELKEYNITTVSQAKKELAKLVKENEKLNEQIDKIEQQIQEKLKEYE